MLPEPKKPGTVYTFYSYKGGVGRSMALANVAALLARGGSRVLGIDWDLEAPGLERYFLDRSPHLAESRAATPGLIDLVYGYVQGQPPDWRKCLLKAWPFGPNQSSLSILSAGMSGPEYVRKVQGADWRKLFDEHDMGQHFEDLRGEWAAEFDFVLIDSRTGISDIGGISPSRCRTCWCSCLPPAARAWTVSST